VRGQAIYDAKCAPCHGADGKGQGPAAAPLSPRPRDFTSGKFMLRSPDTGQLPTVEDLIRTIRQGAFGTSMPGWAPFLSDADIRDVVHYLKSFTPRFASETPALVEIPTIVPANTATLAHGAQIYAKLQCAKCHGTDGGGTGAVAVELVDDWGRPTVPTALTEPWTFRGGSRPDEIYLRLRGGMNGTPMPSFASAATPPEMFDLAIYVASLGRKPAWDMTADELAAFYQAEQDAAAKNPIARGRHLVETMGCVTCHTPIREDGSLVQELRLAGGQRTRVEPYGTFVSTNLTSDPATGLGVWTNDQIKKAIVRGVRRDGSVQVPYPMPWSSYANMKPADLIAMVAYLRTLPAISNRIPERDYPNIAAYLWGKFRMLILKQDPPTYVYAGNAGNTDGRGQ
jgi:mono/diheme cytochrome c family protein